MVVVVLLPLTICIEWPVDTTGPASTSKPPKSGALNESVSASPLVRVNSTRNISPAATIIGVLTSKVVVPSAKAVVHNTTATKVNAMCLKKLSILLIILGFVLQGNPSRTHIYALTRAYAMIPVKRNNFRVYFTAQEKNITQGRKTKFCVPY